MSKNTERLASLRKLIDRLNMNDFERERAYKDLRELDTFFKNYECFIEESKE